MALAHGPCECGETRQNPHALPNPGALGALAQNRPEPCHADQCLEGQEKFHPQTDQGSPCECACVCARGCVRVCVGSVLFSILSWRPLVKSGISACVQFSFFFFTGYFYT